jgi:hypothetical protein
MKVKLSGPLSGAYMKGSYKDLTVEDLKAIKGDAPRDLIAALCGVPRGLIDRIGTADVLALYEIAQFVEDPAEIAAALRPGDYLPEPDIANAAWQKVELARLRASTHKSRARLLPELVRIFYGPELLTGPAAPCMALGAMILNGLVLFLERFKDLGGEKPTDEQLEAGVESLHSFGPYAIADQLGEKYGVRPYEIFDWAAEEVYMSLLFDQAKSKYQQNFSDIERRKNPPRK